VTEREGLDRFEIGVGTWSWGDKSFWGYGRGYGDADLRGAFDAAIASGVRFFDTAEIYGFGKSERLLGRFIAETGERVSIATKFFPYPWRVAASQLLGALRRSLDRLGVAQVDLYQTHWPLPPRSVSAWMEPMAVAEG
jgi:aryl-alcohol dehydrogenase-like predicted oxidoreductase